MELNELRLQYAQLIAEVARLSCAFNSTVYQDTLQYVPEIVAWGERHIDVVHVLAFITFRAALVGGAFDYYVGGERVALDEIPTPRASRSRSESVPPTCSPRFGSGSRISSPAPT